MAAIITSGTTDFSSADQVVAPGATLTISLFYAVPTSPPTNAVAVIELKGSNGVYTEFGIVSMATGPRVLDGAGTYRVSRYANKNVGAQAFGVDAN